jgi:hypothetical protein
MIEWINKERKQKFMITIFDMIIIIIIFFLFNLKTNYYHLINIQYYFKCIYLYSTSFWNYYYYYIYEKIFLFYNLTSISKYIGEHFIFKISQHLLLLLVNC